MSNKGMSKTALNTVKKSKDSLSETRIRSVFQPLFNPNSHITKDADGREVKGTALLIFQGYLNSMIEWRDKVTQEPLSKEKLALVFAVKASDKSFKNIPILTNYTYQPGNLLDLTLKSLGITDFIEQVVDDNEEDTDFSIITVLDDAKIKDSLEELRGFAYTAEMELITTSKGMGIYQILVKTIKPRLDKDNNHWRRQTKEETNPSAVNIDWES